VDKDEEEEDEEEEEVGRGGGGTGLGVLNSSSISQYNYSECIYKKARNNFLDNNLLLFYLREEGINTYIIHQKTM
jgi:hypothetical protein